MSAALPAARASLWMKGDARRLAVLLGGAAVCIAASWFFAAGRPDAGDQMIFVTLSLFGMLVAAAGILGWARRGRRAIRARVRLLLGSAPAVASLAPVARELMAGPDARWFHRADCLLVEGRNWPASPATDHRQAGRRPCPACRP